MSVERWKTVPPDLKTLAVMSAAATVGCEWCMDFGYWAGMADGIEPVKVHDMPQWRESAAYTDLERAAIEYAEVMSTTPVTVTDLHVARLRERLDEAQIVELTMIIAVENQRARFNSALGLTSQGFSDRCELKPARGTVAVMPGHGNTTRA